MRGALGATLPHDGSLTSLTMEIILTAILVTVILATAANYKVVGHNAAIAVAATIALDGLFAAPISGSSMNPARSLGPAPGRRPAGVYVDLHGRSCARRHHRRGHRLVSAGPGQSLRPHGGDR